MENSLEKYLKRVEEAVALHKFPPHPAELYSPMSYILSLGGKRIRPVLALMSGEAFGKSFSETINAAMAVEFFHNFSLIHDDIMDKAPLRRGNPTVHEKWNTNIAILSGDGMLIEAYKLFENYPPEITLSLMRLFNKTATEVCEGQQMDMNFESRNDVTLDEYIKMIQLKTAVLLGCSLQMGAIIGQANEEDQKNIYRFGLNLGTAFQVQDDYLDVYADQQKFGKQVGGDILANKKTFLSLLALQKANEFEKNQLISIQHISNPEEKINLTKELYAQLKVDELSLQEINVNYQAAMENLQALNIDENYKSMFKDLGNYLMNRQS